MKLKLLPVLTLSFFITTVVALSSLPSQIFSATAEHVVISEVQIAGATSTQDFVELYNPTDSEVDLADYRIVKRTSTGASDTNVVAFEEGDVIAPHSYFLWCNSELAATITCDKSTTGTVANNNSVGLRNGAVDTGVLVDAVTFGEVTNTLGEGTVLTAPEASQSVERKACASSTSESMLASEASSGNAEDTDNNANDFVTRTTPQPQNKSNSAEIPTCGSPTPTATAAPTASPTPTVSATPTATATPTTTPSATPSPSPTPTLTPSPTPSATPTSTSSPTPSPTPTVTSTPTTSPTPTLTATPSPTATATPTSTPNLPGRFRFTLECSVTYKTYGGRFFTIIIPRVTCELVPLT